MKKQTENKEDKEGIEKFHSFTRVKFMIMYGTSSDRVTVCVSVTSAFCPSIHDTDKV